MNFLQAMKNKCEGMRVIVILDNLKIHHSKKLEQVYDTHFKEMLLPTYSSELNPIERLWSLLKRKWTQNLTYYVHEVQERLAKTFRKKDTQIKDTIAKLRETIGK